MSITIHAPGEHQYKTPLQPVGPVTEVRWYKARHGSGLTIVRRASVDGEVERVTFYVELFGHIRRLRLINTKPTPAR